MAEGDKVGVGNPSVSSPSVSDDCKPVFDKIDQWRKSLIDLTRRNRLLYLTDKSAEKYVEITSPGPQELIDILIEKDGILHFPMPIYDQLMLPSPQLESDAAQVSPVRKGDLETNLPVVELQRRLGRLRRDQLTSEEEQGIHTLFLATAFLKWDEKPTDGKNQEYLAPIILVPISLDRKSVDDPYHVKLSEEDVVINPALLFKLKTDFGITLPELPDELEGKWVEPYLEKVEQTITDLGWQVLRNVRLGKFTYEKFVMYDDLADHRKDGCNQPTIRALAKAFTPPPDEDIAVPYNLDDAVNPREIFPLLDADSSQMEVLLRFRHNQNLVIEGPPGTGKSQTIANLISQGLRDGKKILFVSEKIAALEVVNRRLQSAGLSFACLEVHSHKSDNKLRVVQELAKTLSQSQIETIQPDIDGEYQKLITLRNRLNGYVAELHKIRGGLKLTAFEVNGKIVKILDAPRVDFKLPVDSVLRITQGQLDGFREALYRIARTDGVFDNLENHPWKGVEFRIADESGLPLDPSLFVDDVEATLKSLKSDLSDLKDTVSSFTTTIGVSQPGSIRGMEGCLRAVGLLSRPQVVADSWTRLSIRELNDLISGVKELGDLSRQLTEKKMELANSFRLGLLAIPASEMLDKFEREYRTPLRPLKSGYRHDLKTLIQFSTRNHKIGYNDAIRALSDAKQIIEIQGKFDSGYSEAKKTLGQFYQGEGTDWGSTIAKLEWLSGVMEEFGLSNIPDQLRELILDPDQLSKFCQSPQAQFGAALSKVVELVSKLEQSMKSYTIEGGTLVWTPITKLESWLDIKANPDDLQNWLTYQNAKEKCHVLGLTLFLTAAKNYRIPADGLDDAFMGRMWKTWLAEAYRESPVLRDFVAASHEQVIQEFQSADKKLKDLTVKMVRQDIAKSQPKADVVTAQASQVGIILREARKKRRVMPLRKLFAEAPQLIQDLKPCLLMSPLSVASYLGTSPYRFDWVIFDEASQIPPADAIGSILRGSHIIVAGDDRQLPPTRFFQADVDYDDEDDDGLQEPLESILDECSTVPGFRRVFLKWHYRSKREELIDFSNRNFYDGKLVTFPSPDSRDAPTAIEFHHVPDGVYDRGGSKWNIKEAREVCDLIEEHFRQHGPGVSLGVITLGIAQEEAIWDELDRRRIADPNLAAQSESNQDEPFFIKSLEKVQGDERDCIIISLGFGKDMNGVLSLNFGPINKAGGERRLNVAITRAKEKVILVSSILPQEMDLTRSSTRSLGVSMLAKYLEYAYQGGRLPTQTYGGGEPESDFEYDVRERLIARGFVVDAQVGCSGFRIDLAIRNPLHSDRYILGIECDGATYHSQRSARDRDRLRQAVLEKLGWRIYRVWSTEWVKNPARIVDSISTLIKELQELGPSAAGVLGPEMELGQDDANQISDSRQEDAKGQQSSPRPVQSPQYGFKSYIEYRQQGTRPNDVGYLAQMIVQKETPIHIDALIRRIADSYGLKRLGPNNRRTIMLHIRQAAARNKFQIHGEFCWIGNEVVPRVPQPGESPRPIQEIPMEELMVAATMIVENQRGIPRESLVREVARVFGYKRTGDRVDSRVNQAIDRLYKEGTFSTYGNQIIITPKPQ